MSGLGQIRQSGANSISTGSTWAPSLRTWSPRRSVTRSGWPWAVAHTACTMFPRSKRPVFSARSRSTESAANPTAYAAIATQSRSRGLGPARHQEVSERAALDAHEKPIKLEERAEGDDGGALTAGGLDWAPPVEVSFIDMPMVERRDREPPCGAALDRQSAGGHGLQQGGARVAADVAGPLVAPPPQARVPGHREGGDAAGAEHPGGLGHGAAVVLDVLQDLAEHDRVEALVGERERRRVGACDLAAEPCAEHLDRRGRGVGADHVKAPRGEPRGERALA